MNLMWSRAVPVNLGKLNLIAVLFWCWANHAQVGATEISIGANVRVGAPESRQAEPYVASHPLNAGSLIISVSEVVGGLDSKGLLARSYFSNDGGRTWAVSDLPGLREALVEGRLQTVLDTWVTFAPNGESYFTALPFTAEEQAPIYFYRSPDSGRTWLGPTVLGSGGDQPKTVASMRNGTPSIYIAAAERGVVLLNSVDLGQSFHEIARIEPDNLSHQAMNPLVLADGSVLLPYLDFPGGRTQRLHSARIYVTRSEVGGSSFSLPRFVADIPRPYPGTAHFAVDLSDGEFQGRVYATWEDGDFGPQLVRSGDQFVRRESGTRREVTVAHSTDNGRTWSPPRILQTESRGSAHFATAAVSQEGVLGVFWIQHDSYEPDRRCYQAWFAASLDGGSTFSPSMPVSADASCPEGRLNPEPFFTTRPRGGDYVGLAVAADGSFHAAWPDARDGAFRLYTARITVRSS